MSNKPVSLANFAQVKVSVKAQSLEEVENIPLTITKAEIHKGDFTPYVIFTATTKEGAIVTVRTSNPMTIQALQAAGQADSFPVEATFKHDGSKWVIE